MARLPTPGSDNGTWGDVLNEYLLESLKADGTIKDNAVTSNTIAPNSITNAAIASDAVNASSIADGSITNALLADGTIQEAKLSSDVQTKLNASGTPDWSDIANKPAVIAAGADQASARVAIGAGTSNLTIGTTGTTAKAGDYQPSAANISDATTMGRSILTAANASAVKTSLSLSKSDVGLSNVDNTSDATKNSAAATLTSKTIDLANNTLTGTTAQFNTALSDNNFATQSGNETLTNKAISGASNTLTDIPASAIIGLGTDYSKLVCTTAAGAMGAEDGTNSWAKIATFSTGTNEFAEAQLLLSVTNTNSGNHDTAIVSVYFRTNSSGTNPTVDVKIISKGGNGFIIASDSFKVISGGWSSDLELWFRKGAPYGRLQFYETSKSITGGTLTYTSNPAWQSTTPTGTVNNVSSNGVYSGLSMVVNGKISTSGINDTNGNSAIDIGAIPNAVNRVYIDNQSTGNYPTIGATGPDTDIGLALAPKNNGPVNLFGNAPTIAASGGYNGGNLDLNLKSQGTGKVTANGKPVMTSQMAYPFYTDPGRFEPWPQIMCAGGNWTLGSGDMPMTFFVPSTDMTVTNIITMGWNDTTQSGASACRVAIYRVDNLFTWPADMTCIARSAHKPDRWNGAVVDIAPIVDNGAASPSAISSINLTAGQQYAVAFLSVGHSGTVKLSALGGFRKNTLEPHVGFFAGGGYTDITEHLTGGYIEEWTFVWFGLT